MWVAQHILAIIAIITIGLGLPQYSGPVSVLVHDWS